MLLLLAAMLVGVDAPPQLQGSWYTVEEEVEGSFAVEFGELPSLGFKGETFLAYGRPAGRYRIDPGKSPKTIDFLVEAGPAAETTEAGIYKFEGQSLVICSATDGAPRPKDFTVPKGSKRRLITYERAPRPRDPRSAGDRAYLQGDWLGRDRLTFDGDTRFRWGQAAGRYANDADKDPKTIDFVYASGVTERGIYKFEGTFRDKVLVLAIGTPRPTDFEVTEGSNQRVMTYTQQAKRRP
jgi:uncharacterized protein (TIGR03067 family)